MKGRASQVGIVRGVDRNEVRMIVVSDTEGELAAAMRSWIVGKRRGEGGLFLGGDLYHGKSHGEVVGNVRVMIGPELARLPVIPRVDVPPLPEIPRLPL